MDIERRIESDHDEGDIVGRPTKGIAGANMDAMPIGARGVVAPLKTGEELGVGPSVGMLDAAGIAWLGEWTACGLYCCMCDPLSCGCSSTTCDGLPRLTLAT